MPTYATAADALDYIDGLVIDDDAAFGLLLERAERDVDNVLGPVPISNLAAGLKYDPTELRDWEAAALSRAVCAQVEHRLANPAAGTERRAAKITGPVFSVEYATDETSGTGLIGPKVKLELASIGHLRGLTARARA